MAHNRNKGKEKVLDKKPTNEKTYLLSKKSSQSNQSTDLDDHLTILPMEILHYLITFLPEFQDILKLSICNRSMRHNLLSASTKYDVVINKQDPENMQIKKGTLAEVLYILKRGELEREIVRLKSEKRNLKKETECADDDIWIKRSICWIVTGGLPGSATCLTLAMLELLKVIALDGGVITGIGAAVTAAPCLIHSTKLAGCCLFKTAQANCVENQINHSQSKIDYNIDFAEPINRKMKK